MCCGGPPFGIPIPEEVHNLFPEEVKRAYEVFADWLSDQNWDKPLKRSSMPLEAERALQTIMTAPIPGQEDHTASESCFIVSVLSRMED